jgi:hypothetical protein
VFLGIITFIRVLSALNPPAAGWVYVSRDVTFDENIFPFSKLHPNAGARLRFEILLLPSSLNSLPNGVNNCDLPGANSPNCENPYSTIFDDMQLANMDGTTVKADSPRRQTPEGADSSANPISMGMDSLADLVS